MKVLLVDGEPRFYRPENEEEEKEMLMSLARAIRERRLVIPVAYTDLINRLTKLAGKDIKEALKIVRSDSKLQAMCSAMYSGEHPTYNPSELNEVDAEDELTPDALAFVKGQAKNTKPLKRSSN